jgi:putative OPT family oligopeptide transporter
VARGVFGGDLPWGMVAAGAGIGAAVIAADEWLRLRGSAFRMPVLAVAVGIYLPLELSVPIALGGVVAWWAGARGEGPGLLAAAGLITGEALMGIALAVPIAFSGQREILAVVDEGLGAWPGLLLAAGLCLWLARARSPRSPSG